MALINTTTTGVLGTTVYGDGQGALTVQKDGVTQGVFGNQPAFSVYLSSNQTGVTNSTSTKIQFNTKVFDTNSNFDSSTNYRFTPTVAGYYQLNAGCNIYGGNQPARGFVAIFKNGSEFYRGQDISGTYVNVATVSGLVYLNGTTDYVEFYGWGVNASGLTFGAGASLTYANGVLVRAA